jgi:hypothetical protein
MQFAAQSKETAKAHHQRTPARRIYMGARAIPDQEVFVDVQLDNVHLENIGVHVLAERTVMVDDSLQLYGTFKNTRRIDRFRCHRRHS